MLLYDRSFISVLEMIGSHFAIRRRKIETIA